MRILKLYIHVYTRKQTYNYVCICLCILCVRARERAHTCTCMCICVPLCVQKQNEILHNLREKLHILIKQIVITVPLFAANSIQMSNAVRCNLTPALRNLLEYFFIEAQSFVL